MEVQQGSGQAAEGMSYGEQSDQISKAKPEGFTSSHYNTQFDFLLCKADPEAAGAPLEAVPGVSAAEQMQTSVRTTEQKNSAVEL